MTQDQIREIFLRNGFTVKEGQTDLKDYVYAAADELLKVFSQELTEAVDEAKQYLDNNTRADMRDINQALTPITDILEDHT